VISQIAFYALSRRAGAAVKARRMIPALYLSHGAPPLVDDELVIGILDGPGETVDRTELARIPLIRSK
jgi:hypothetical protein